MGKILENNLATNLNTCFHPQNYSQHKTTHKIYTYKITTIVKITESHNNFHIGAQRGEGFLPDPWTLYIKFC